MITKLLAWVLHWVGELIDVYYYSDEKHNLEE